MRWPLVSSILFPAALLAQTDSTRAIELLRANCSSCHGTSVQMSNLRLDSRDGLVKGGVKGPAIVSGNSAESRLIKVVSHAALPTMPPGRKLADADVAILRSWIDSGAAWPKENDAVEVKAASWWSFRPIAKTALSHTERQRPIDAFLDPKIKAAGLTPTPRASRAVLVRRAYYDLHGLAPTFEQSQKFINDGSPDAWQKLIDELLASPRYGEKWGRHWLDLVRYGDTAGFEQDPYILDAWRYRDYVIESFNSDKPYDRFVKEQIAGDEIYPDDPKSRMGTGYFNVGTNRDMLYKVEDINRIEQLTDYTDTTSSVFMGLTVGCARCHDHKFDPIPQKDYYRLQAIFVPAVKNRIFLDYNAARGYDIGLNVREFKLRDVGDEIATIQRPYREAIRKRKIAALDKDLREAFETEDAQRTPAQRVLVDSNPNAVRVSQTEIYTDLSADDRARLDALGRKLIGFYAAHTSGPIAPGVMDLDRVSPDNYMPLRGQSGLGVKVGPGLLSALGGGDIPEPAPDAVTTFRRKALAEWLTSPEHPLTARVMANRIWQFHFGRGIVATSSDFGTRGAAPSHPELLDYLASEFVSGGWTIKRIHRLIMMSDAYQRDANASPAVRDKDPENIWLSYFNRRRLTAEEVRDGVLQASGTLNLKMGGRPVVPPQTKEELYGMSQPADNFWPVSWNKEDHTRRTVYSLVRRSYRPPLMEAFDGLDGTLSCARRDQSTVVPQSLTLMNSDFAYDQARALAARLRGESGVAKIAARAYRGVLGREASPEEIRLTTAFLEKQQKQTGTLEAALVELSRAMFNLNEFLYVD